MILLLGWEEYEPALRCHRSQIVLSLRKIPFQFVPLRSRTYHPVANNSPRLSLPLVPFHTVLFWVPHSAPAYLQCRNNWYFSRVLAAVVEDAVVLGESSRSCSYCSPVYSCPSPLSAVKIFLDRNVFIPIFKVVLSLTMLGHVHL